jgi:hypothetical protein
MKILEIGKKGVSVAVHLFANYVFKTQDFSSDLCTEVFRVLYMPNGRDSLVGLVTFYGLESPGIESSLGARFSLKPIHPPIQRVPGLFPGDRAAVAWR